MIAIKNIQFIIKVVLQLGLLIGLNSFGNWIVHFLNIPLPGSVVGLIILLALLLMNVIKMSWIEETSSFLNKHLGFFFIPICVGLITIGNIIVIYGLPLIIVLTVSAIIGISVTGKLTEHLILKKEAKMYEYDHAN